MIYGENILNKPQKCDQCSGRMEFKGVGEYKCEDCKHLEYDDYGKVRIYVETHRGATIAEIESAIGVTQKSIRQMVRDGRFNI